MGTDGPDEVSPDAAGVVRTLRASEVGRRLVPAASKRAVIAWAREGVRGSVCPHEEVRIGKQTELRFCLEEVAAWCASAGLKYVGGAGVLFEGGAGAAESDAGRRPSRDATEPGSESRATKNSLGSHGEMFAALVEESRGLIEKMTADPEKRTVVMVKELSGILRGLGVEVTRIERLRAEEIERLETYIERSLAARLVLGVAEAFASGLASFAADAPAVIRAGLAGAGVDDLSETERFDRAVFAAVDRRVRSVRENMAEQARRAAVELRGKSSAGAGKSEEGALGASRAKGVAA